MSTFQVGILGGGHTDARRAITEFNGDFGSVQHFEITGDAGPLGKHHHERKYEVFTILEGEGEVLLCNSHQGKQASSVIERFPLTKGSIVYVAPGMAHTFYLSVGTRMICYSSESFNENDKDMVATPWLVRESLAQNERR